MINETHKKQKTLFEQWLINRDEYMDSLAKRIAQNRTARNINRI